VGKSKLNRFREMEQLERVFQPPFGEVFGKDFYLKGRWNSEVFHNDHPIILELGCGKGEYTIGLARLLPGNNYIGIDIKGARMWRGAKMAHDTNLTHVAFLRTRIEMIESFFGRDEIDEIWITFPDPQLKRRRNKKRLTGPRFLNSYRMLLKDNGIIHLKTDNEVLYNYTLELVKHNGLDVLHQTSDLYGTRRNARVADIVAQPYHSSSLQDKVLSIKTFYESQYLDEGASIYYLSFRLPSSGEILEWPGDDE